MPSNLTEEQASFSTAEPFHRSPERFRLGWLRRGMGEVLGKIGDILVNASERLHDTPDEILPLGDQMVVAAQQEGLSHDR